DLRVLGRRGVAGARSAPPLQERLRAPPARAEVSVRALLRAVGMAKITVDGTDYEVTEGRTILQALDDLGVLMSEVEIPHYCWHPKLTIDGSARLCQGGMWGLPTVR